MRRGPESQPQVPLPETRAYFPKRGISEMLADEAMKRAGDNLVCAFEYGSFVTGDASKDSRRDVMFVVNDVKKYHKENIDTSAKDYGRPHSVKFHTVLNKFGFNFYHTALQTDEGQVKVKYAVISATDFIKGCNGTTKEKTEDGTGAFGLYVAGRIQKQALSPFFTGNEEQIAAIQTGINSARIDGLAYAITLQDHVFSLDDVIKTYVSLSYMADLRVEKPGKVQTLIDQSKGGYQEMLQPLLDEFVETSFVHPTERGLYAKGRTFSPKEVEARLKEIKLRTALINYVKNPLSAGVGNGIIYGWEKVKRSGVLDKKMAQINDWRSKLPGRAA